MEFLSTPMGLWAKDLSACSGMRNKKEGISWLTEWYLFDSMVYIMLRPATDNGLTLLELVTHHMQQTCIVNY